MYDTPSQNPWKDFSTAPKDGTPILAWRWDAGTFAVRYQPSANAPIECIQGGDPCVCKECDNLSDCGGWAWFTLEGDDVLSDGLPDYWMSYPELPAHLQQSPR